MSSIHTTHRLQLLYTGGEGDTWFVCPVVDYALSHPLHLCLVAELPLSSGTYGVTGPLASEHGVSTVAKFGNHSTPSH
ncbi:hypothetical protein ACOMHN_002554 [Nucella lapillus]